MALLQSIPSISDVNMTHPPSPEQIAIGPYIIVLVRLFHALSLIVLMLVLLSLRVLLVLARRAAASVASATALYRAAPPAASVVLARATRPRAFARPPFAPAPSAHRDHSPSRAGASRRRCRFPFWQWRPARTAGRRRAAPIARTIRR